MKTIEIVVSPTGETQVETKGFSGTACQVASRFLENVLGKKESGQLTREFYSSPSQSNTETQQEG